MEISWSHTPSSVWWALEASSSISLDGHSPPGSLRPRLEQPGKDITNFYDYADEGETVVEEELQQWVVQHPSRGVVRVYQPGSTYSELVRCSVDTTADGIMARCLAKELFVQYGSGLQRTVQLDEHPLELQNQFLQSIGFTDPQRIQLEGISDDLAPLFKLVTGQERGKRPEDNVQLACPLKVKELNGLGVWNKRFCVLCGARLFIFPTSRPKGKPSLVLDLTGGRMLEHKNKKSYYCVKVVASRREVLLAFDSRLEQSRWLERAAKVVSRHPLEVNLAGYSLERVPKYFFLNYYLVAMNLSRNFMKENFSHKSSTMTGQIRVIGWINDLTFFHHLVSLSLSSNELEQFPISLCAIATLQELDISRNKIRVLPQEVQRLTNLTTLLLHSNQLTSLPRGLVDLKQLSTLVIAFNQFVEIPPLLKELPSLSILIASGNVISVVPDDIILIQYLQHFDMRLNLLKSPLPATMSELLNLTRFNVRGTGISELDMKRLPYLEELNCADNQLQSLVVHEGPLRSLMAANNNISQFVVAPTCSQLTSINLSKNSLTSLPEPLTGLQCLEKLNVSSNKLTVLPAGTFTNLKHLDYLNLSGNPLTSFPPLLHCHHLHTLLLHSTLLPGLPDSTPLHRLHTLDLSCSKLKEMPNLQGFYQLKHLDLSSNTSLRVREKDRDIIKPLSRCVVEGGVGLHSEVRGLPHVESGAAAKHSKWSFGSAQIIGMDTDTDCTVQVKAPTLPSSKDGMFAIMDGGRSPDAPVIIQKILPDVLMTELASQEIETKMKGTPSSGNSLEYLTHTFLTAHKLLGETGHTYGCSLVLCHLHVLRSRKVVLNVANTGLGEAILCRRGQAVPLTTPHSPATCEEERARVKEAGGFISQDYRVNGVCGASRLLGCYHLSPEVIPAPTTVSVEIRPGDDYIIIGSDGLWRNVSYEQAVQTVHSVSDVASASRKLRDMAVAHGCKTDVSVIVVKLDVSDGVELEASLVQSEHPIPEPEPEPDQDEDVEFTNIDDILSDTEDDPEPRQSTPSGVTLRTKKAKKESELDRMLLGAVSSPPTSPTSPVMKSTNIDEILSSSPSPLPLQYAPPSHYLHTPHLHPVTHEPQERERKEGRGRRRVEGERERGRGGSEIGRIRERRGGRGGGGGGGGGEGGGGSGKRREQGREGRAGEREEGAGEGAGGGGKRMQGSRGSEGRGERESGDEGGSTRGGSHTLTPKSALHLNGLNYPAQTIPRDAAASRTKGGDASPPLPPSQTVDYNSLKDSFQMTQSAPFIPSGHGSLDEEVERSEVRRGRLRRERGERRMQGAVRGEVVGQNMEEYLSALNKAMSALDSDAGPGEAQYGGKIVRRLSYVEHSYQQLTNNVYSEGLAVGSADMADLDNWST